MKKIILTVIILGVTIALFLSGVNFALTELIELTNIVCFNQRFSTVEQAIKALETEELSANDTSLDFCPPHNVKYTFEYQNSVIVFYDYYSDYDTESSNKNYAVRILKHNEDGTLSFDSGFAEFITEEPSGNENYYYFTNIDTDKGKKSISFLYLSADSDKDIYVDGVKAEKILVSIDDKDFYICYSVSNKDTFISNFFTSISNRHKIEIK